MKSVAKIDIVAGGLSFFGAASFLVFWGIYLFAAMSDHLSWGHSVLSQLDYSFSSEYWWLFTYNAFAPAVLVMVSIQISWAGHVAPVAQSGFLQPS